MIILCVIRYVSAFDTSTVTVFEFRVQRFQLIDIILSENLLNERFISELYYTDSPVGVRFTLYNFNLITFV